MIVRKHTNTHIRSHIAGTTVLLLDSMAVNVLIRTTTENKSTASVLWCYWLRVLKGIRTVKIIRQQLQKFFSHLWGGDLAWPELPVENRQRQTKEDVMCRCIGNSPWVTALMEAYCMPPRSTAITLSDFRPKYNWLALFYEVQFVYNLYIIIRLIHGNFPSLLWRQEGHPTCKKLGVGWLVVTFWLELCTSYSSNCHHSPP